jgi:hypothetical protein
MNSPPLWKIFEGRTNTEDLLREKASIVSELIAMTFDAPETIASQMNTKFQKKIVFSQTEAASTKAETGALWLHIIDRYYAFKILSRKERDVFMSALEATIAERLRLLGVDRRNFLEILQARYAEYIGYKFVPVNEEGNTQGTLLWEFDKKVAAILGAGKSFWFNQLLSNLILEHLNSWELHALLKA